MNTKWQPKPGDRVFRPSWVKHYRLRRVLGVPGLFSAGYSDVGSSIYYGLGVVALVALGGTPIVLAIAGIIYIFNALTFAEGSAMIPEAGGSASFARSAFNDLVGFNAGWALMLNDIATVAISAYTIPPYLGYFWPVLKEPVAGTATSMGIIVLLMLINILGVKESSRLNIFFIIIDILTQLTLITLGVILILIPNPGVLFQHMFGAGNWPSTQNLIYGIAIAALCFTGVDTISELSQEARKPGKTIPQAYILMIVTIFILFAGVSLVALTAMTPQALGDPTAGWARDPVAGIANGISSVMSPREMATRITSQEELGIVLTWIFTGIRNMLPVLVAILASTILLVAANGNVLGISRLTYNMSSYRQLPAALSRVHHRFRTPYVAIILFGLICLLVLIPGFFSPGFFADLGAIYVFGSLLCFALSHAAILGLRVRRPDLPRPFKLRGNIRVRGRELPITAVLGLIATSGIWLVIVIIQPYSRWAGIAWMLVGLIVYYLYRRSQHLPLTHLRSDSAKPD